MTDRAGPCAGSRVYLLSCWVPDQKVVPDVDVHVEWIPGTVVVEGDLVDHNDAGVHDNTGGPWGG